MRKIAFGYSTRCNVKCEHCVAADAVVSVSKMELARGCEIISELAAAGVKGISFTAGEPLIYLDDICTLVGLCQQHGIYSRVVTNSFWAKTSALAETIVLQLKKSGLNQLRLSYSRWHQKNIPAGNVVNAARACTANGVDYFVSFVTDFTQEDDTFEQFLRDKELLFFPEPVIYSGRALRFARKALHTDYQENCCPMNPYLAPTQEVYACCDAGSHFTKTDFFRLGSLQTDSIENLLLKSEQHVLYNSIRTIGISGIASYIGFAAREIVRYRKCELCEKIFNSKKLLARLEEESQTGLARWHR